METVYWTMKNGQKIDVDAMEINHLRSTLKMIIKNQVRVNATKPVTPKFKFNGDIAQNHIETMQEQDYFDECDSGFDYWKS